MTTDVTCPRCGHSPMGFVSIGAALGLDRRAEHCGRCGYIQERTVDLAGARSRSMAGEEVEPGETVRPVTRADMDGIGREDVDIEP